MVHKVFGAEFLRELESEAPASRKCLERVPASLFSWKPHEKSMQMGYLALVVADIPRWISTMIREGEINFGTFSHVEAKTPEELVQQFDRNMAEARQLLEKVTDEELGKPFYLKNQDKILISSTIKEMIGSSINHLVHHRGQLTVYLRLNDIPVPMIYGPSADEGRF